MSPKVTTRVFTKQIDPYLKRFEILNPAQQHLTIQLRLLIACFMTFFYCENVQPAILIAMKQKNATHREARLIYERHQFINLQRQQQHIIDCVKYLYAKVV